MRLLFRILRFLFALVGIALMGGFIVVSIIYIAPQLYTFGFLDHNKFVVSNEVFNVVLGLIVAVVLGFFLFVTVAILKKILGRF